MIWEGTFWGPGSSWRRSRLQHKSYRFSVGHWIISWSDKYHRGKFTSSEDPTAKERAQWPQIVALVLPEIKVICPKLPTSLDVSQAMWLHRARGCFVAAFMLQSCPVVTLFLLICCGYGFNGACPKEVIFQLSLLMKTGGRNLNKNNREHNKPYCWYALTTCRIRISLIRTMRVVGGFCRF